MTQYIQTLESIAENMVESGKSAEEAHLQPVPSPFDTWWSFDNFFTMNLEFLCKRATQATQRKRAPL
jgi:hypothetical protein